MEQVREGAVAELHRGIGREVGRAKENRRRRRKGPVPIFVFPSQMGQ